jgi:hypothetical protein
MEKFKFATIKNVRIDVEEGEYVTEIRIETLNKDKPVSIMYMPSNHHLEGEFAMFDDHSAEILISKTHPVGTSDGDVDWEIEQVYPCPLCEHRAREDRKKALEN